MKSIQNLIPDIYKLVGRKDGWFTSGIAQDLGEEIARRLGDQFNKPVPKPALRLSQMGPKCPRALWYSIHRPELAEKFSGPNLIKFSYGHILEAMVIELAKIAGHEVTGEQDELVVDGIKGHRDCVIDGYIVDVKSVSSRQYPKFKDGTLALDDSFGYLDQLDGYLVGSAEDDLVRYKDVAYDLAVDKTLGNMVLYEHHLRHDHILERISSHKRIVALDVPPPCTCETKPDGKSGNIILGVAASYSAFKHECFPHLRTFLYSGGPRFFAKVVKSPFYEGKPLAEVDRHGNYVYNN